MSLFHPGNNASQDSSIALQSIHSLILYPLSIIRTPFTFPSFLVILLLRPYTYHFYFICPHPSSAYPSSAHSFFTYLLFDFHPFPFSPFLSLSFLSLPFLSLPFPIPSLDPGQVLHVRSRSPELNSSFNEQENIHKSSFQSFN